GEQCGFSTELSQKRCGGAPQVVFHPRHSRRSSSRDTWCICRPSPRKSALADPPDFSLSLSSSRSLISGFKITRLKFSVIFDNAGAGLPLVVILALRSISTASFFAAHRQSAAPLKLSNASKTKTSVSEQCHVSRFRFMADVDFSSCMLAGALWIPYVFLTNGGGFRESIRALELSTLLGINASSLQVLQGHTPFIFIFLKLVTSLY
ncbi:unnamed protein product, partial [Linum tenue]